MCKPCNMLHWSKISTYPTSYIGITLENQGIWDIQIKHFFQYFLSKIRYFSFWAANGPKMIFFLKKNYSANFYLRYFEGKKPWPVKIWKKIPLLPTPKLSTYINFCNGSLTNMYNRCFGFITFREQNLDSYWK